MITDLTKVRTDDIPLATLQVLIDVQGLLVEMRDQNAQILAALGGVLVVHVNPSNACNFTPSLEPFIGTRHFCGGCGSELKNKMEPIK